MDDLHPARHDDALPLLWTVLRGQCRDRVGRRMLNEDCHSSESRRQTIRTQGISGKVDVIVRGQLFKGFDQELTRPSNFLENNNSALA